MYIGYTKIQKDKAINLYLKGKTLKKIALAVGCNAGTLSRWFKHLPKVNKCGPPKGNSPWNKSKSFPQMYGNKFAFKDKDIKKNTGNRRAQTKFREIKPCTKCKKILGSFFMIRHHKDGNTLNNSCKNVTFMCRSCHAAYHGRIKNNLLSHKT